MTIEVKGVVTQAGKPEVLSDKFTKHIFVVQTEQGQYPKYMAVQASQKQLENASKLKAGDEVELKVGVNAKEYKGNWYNSLEAFFIQVKSQSSAQPKKAKPVAAPSANDDDGDILPF